MPFRKTFFSESYLFLQPHFDKKGVIKINWITYPNRISTLKNIIVFYQEYIENSEDNLKNEVYLIMVNVYNSPIKNHESTVNIFQNTQNTAYLSVHSAAGMGACRSKRLKSIYYRLDKKVWYQIIT